MSIRSTCKSLVLLVSLGLLISCEEEVTDIGTSFLRDTVLTGSETVNQFFSMSSRTKQTVDANGIIHNLNYASHYLFFGTAPEESLEAWTVLKIPYLPDTTATISSVELVLTMASFMYGTQSEHVEFAVYLEANNKITKGTTSLSLGDLDPTPIATYQASVKNDTAITIRLTLDSARIAPLLRTSGLSLIVVPNASMKNIRAFASTDNASVLVKPGLSVTYKKTDPDSTFVRSEPLSYDFHLITDNATDATGQFSLRGAYARRERIVINTKEIRSLLGLDPYSTVNSASLQLHVVSKQLSLTPVDTIAPVIVEIAAPHAEDSAEFLAAYGTKDQTLSDVYNFQISEFIEQAIRTNQDSLVLELRSGFWIPARTINDEVIGTEDYHLNRWTFYGPAATDSLKRPKLTITYSLLR